MSKRKSFKNREIPGNWAICETYIGEFPAFAYLRDGVGKLVGSHGWVLKARIFWEYEVSGTGAMPTDEQMKTMIECENLLVAAIESDKFGILTHSSICNGVRIWCFYIKDDTQELNKRIRRALPQNNPFPITIEVEEDKEWNEYCSAWAHCRL